MYVNVILSTPLRAFRDNLQHWSGDFARLLKLQFTSNEGMSNDAPVHECESEIDHYTEHCALLFTMSVWVLQRPTDFLLHVQQLVR